jgi:hypothetical protein
MLPEGLGPLLDAQEPDDRIDIVRTDWLEQIEATEQLVRSLEVVTA